MGDLLTQILANAVGNVQKRYPRLASVPMVATTGTGPFHSETYMPWDEENPMPGKLDIQLRSDAALRGRQLEDALTTESFHLLGARMPSGLPYDARWYALKQALEKALKPEDVAASRRLWSEEQKQGENRTYEDMMQRSFLDMLIRGYMFPNQQGAEWVNRMSSGGWSPQEKQVLNQFSGLLGGK